MRDNNDGIAKLIISKRLILQESAVLLIQGVLVFWFFHLERINLNIPILYSGDGLAALAGTKMYLLNGRSMLGWPFHFDLFSYEPVFNGLYRIFIWIGFCFTKNIVLIQNLYILAIPFVNVFSCYLVFRYLKIRNWIASLGALSFGLCPYVQYRLTGHLALAAVECIPLTLLLCCWIVQDLVFSGSFNTWVENKKNPAAFVFSFLIAENGMIYYPFFSCFLILISGFIAASSKKHYKHMIPALILIIMIGGWLSIGFLPSVIASVIGLGQSITYGTRSYIRTLEFALDLKSLLISPNGYGVPILKKLHHNLIELSPDYFSAYEKYTSYMGIAAIAGFIGLLILLFRRNREREEQYWKEADYLSKLNIAMVLLAINNGFCVFVSILIPQISCYNRMSPFIICLSLLYLCRSFEYILSQIPSGQLKKRLFSIFIAGFLIYSLIEQRDTYTTISDREQLAQNQIESESDRAFFQKVEQKISGNGIIFILPYMKTFENGAEQNLHDYDHYKAYLFSDKLKWSFGAMPESENDSWYYQSSMLAPEEMKKELMRNGVSGIYINLNGFDESQGTALINHLYEKSTDGDLLYNKDHTKLYFSLINNK